MITVKQLIELLQRLPSYACVHAYEGEDIGISISHEDRYWWIRARDDDDEDDQDEFEEGFEERPAFTPFREPDRPRWRIDPVAATAIMRGELGILTEKEWCLVDPAGQRHPFRTVMKEDGLFPDRSISAKVQAHRDGMARFEIRCAETLISTLEQEMKDTDWIEMLVPQHQALLS